jgi:hypothetical protein
LASEKKRDRKQASPVWNHDRFDAARNVADIGRRETRCST